MKKLLFIFLLPVSLTAQTWTIYNCGSAELVRHIDFPAADTGYVSLDLGSMRKTTNGAANWSLVTTPALISSFDFVSPQLGFMCTDTSIYKTNDGGNSWTEVFHDNRMQFLKISALNANTVLASGTNLFSSGDSLILYETSNGGSSWSAINSDPSFFPESAICFQNASAGFYAANFSIKSTTNGGGTWATPYNDPNMMNYFVDIDFPNTDTGFALGYDIVFRSVNAGATWTAVTAPGQVMYEQHFINARTGFICGGNGFNSGWVQQTLNAGSSWTPVYTSAVTYDCLSFPSNSLAYFGGDNGTVLKYGAGPMGLLENNIPTVSVYPNPASAEITISNISENSRIRIYTATGQLVMETNSETSETKMDIEHLTNGVYLIEILSDKNVFQSKLLVQ